jgi:hypothetical protein
VKFPSVTYILVTRDETGDIANNFRQPIHANIFPGEKKNHGLFARLLMCETGSKPVHHQQREVKKKKT